MSKLRKPIELQTAFGEYVLHELLGEGGAGRVFGGANESGEAIAIKILANASSDKRRRFKNEISFLSKNKHPNIVNVTDYGVSEHIEAKGPFYVMPRYTGNLRDLIAKQIPPAQVMAYFSQILDGAEAAHLKEVNHRDLKPENILCSANKATLAIADFGIARFTEQELATLVETGPEQRLANFQYAAPEQRAKGKPVTATADIYALGLILNEMFTGAVPQGTDYLTIGATSADLSFLDLIVAQMIKQNPSERPQTIAAVKTLIQKHQAETISLQKLSRIDATVIKAGEIDEPLAYNVVQVVDASYRDGLLILTLDRTINQDWINALFNMGNYHSVMGADTRQFRFHGNTASVPVQVHGTSNSGLQMIIDYFKAWMPQTTNVLKFTLEERARRQEQERREELNRQRVAEERLLRINKTLKV